MRIISRYCCHEYICQVFARLRSLLSSPPGHGKGPWDRVGDSIKHTAVRCQPLADSIIMPTISNDPDVCVWCVDGSCDFCDTAHVLREPCALKALSKAVLR